MIPIPVQMLPLGSELTSLFVVGEFGWIDSIERDFLLLFLQGPNELGLDELVLCPREAQARINLRRITQQHGPVKWVELALGGLLHNPHVGSHR